MSARAIGELITPLIFRACGLARLQHFLDAFPVEERWEWIADFEKWQTITEDEAQVLRQHNLDLCA